MSKAGGKRRWGITANKYEVSYRRDKKKNVLEFDSGNGCTSVTLLKTTEFHTLHSDFYCMWINKAVT